MRAANRRSARSGTLPKPLWTKPPLDFSTTLHPLQLLGPHFTDVEYYCPNQQAREHHREGASEGQSRAWRNCCWIRFPVITVREPPSRLGMTNSPADGMKTGMLPAMTPGMLKGKVTRQKVCHRLAPRS